MRPVVNVTKLLIIGDIHFRTVSPISRKDNIEDVFKDKFKQISELAVKHEVDAILTTGDIFDKARVSNDTLLLAHELIESLPCDLFTNIGNHDMVGNSEANHRSSFLYILEKLCSNLQVIKNNGSRFVEDVALHFNSYGNDTFDEVVTKKDAEYNILLTHSMITETETMFDSINVKDVVTTVDFLIAGHNHSKFLHNNIYNPGALIRLTAAKEDREREVEVGLLTINKHKANLERIPLKISKTEDIFDLNNLKKRKKILNEKMVELLNASMNNITKVSDIISNVIKTSEYTDEELKELKKYIEV